MTSFTDLMRDFTPNEPCSEKLYGKYRGTVLNNIDPMNIGRLQVNVSGVVLASSWAMPSTSVAGIQSGTINLPPIGAGVWVEFEQGELDHPIWTGCFWGLPTDPPRTALLGTPVTPNIVHQTVGQNSITIFGAPGAGITICAGPFESPTSPRIMLTEAGIVLSDGKGGMISLTGGVVTVNMGALVIK